MSNLPPLSEYFEATLVPVGRHHAPQGVVEVTPERSRRWVEMFNRLKADGVRFPMPWGHRLSAIPEEGECTDEEYEAALEQRAAEEARWNATYIDDLHTDDAGNLILRACPPPGYSVCPHTKSLINARDGTRISELSAGIGDWRDGRGRQHKDIIIHAALVPLPVVAGQDGFSLATGPRTLGTSVTYKQTLSTGSRSMAKTKDDIDDETPDLTPETEETPETDDVSPEDDYELPPEETEPEAPELPEPEPETPPVMNNDLVDQLVSLLQQAGLPLPENTNPTNLIERMVTALTVALGMGAKFEHDDSDSTPEGVQPPATAQSGLPQPEAPPMMMSTLSIKDPAMKRMAEREQKRMQNDIRAAWAECTEYGCPVHIADDEAAKASRVMLSLNSKTGKPQLPAALARAQLVLKIFRAMNSVTAPAKPQATLSTVANPSVRTSSTTVSEVAENMAIRVFGAGAKLASFK